ncbi:MAG: hypothetical protein M3Y27_24750, partial [Acidobacteriota bacterium]|nr:hypothetical protein [Acidobacteriota bacterium]
GNGTFQYVNDYYSVAPAPSGIGWKFTSSDGKISKTITLGQGTGALQASYLTNGFVQMYVRFGLSPDLLDLLMNGQSHLSSLSSGATEVDLFNNNSNRTTRAYLRFGGTGLSGATFNATANDTDANVLDTVAMRNQAQTQQVELQGNGAMTFSLGFETGAALTYDSDGDGLPDWWSQKYFGHPTGQARDLSRPGDDPDGDGKTNLQEYILGSNPTVADSAAFGLSITRITSAKMSLKFQTIRDRTYHIYYSSSPNGVWTQAINLPGTGAPIEYFDDGTNTGSPPGTQPRFYRLDVSLP